MPRDRHQPDHRSWPAAAPKLSTRAEVTADIDVASESAVERWERYGAFSDRRISHAATQSRNPKFSETAEESDPHWVRYREHPVAVGERSVVL